MTTPDSVTTLLKLLRKQAALIDAGVTSEEILAQAEKVIAGLTDSERDMTATFYVVHLFKEQHRQKVLSHERDAVKPRRRTRFEATIPADDPYWTKKAERESAFHARLHTIVEDYNVAMKAEWTRELLRSTFALPDGRLVAWGTATVEEHEVRRDMLVRNAEGNIEAAARHAQAINDIRAANASMLNDLAVETVSA